MLPSDSSPFSWSGTYALCGGQHRCARDWEFDEELELMRSVTVTNYMWLSIEAEQNMYITRTYTTQSVNIIRVKK